jgi:hypothetical protein
MRRVGRPTVLSYGVGTYRYEFQSESPDWMCQGQERPPVSAIDRKRVRLLMLTCNASTECIDDTTGAHTFVNTVILSRQSIAKRHIAIA